VAGVGRGWLGAGRVRAGPAAAGSAPVGSVPAGAAPVGSAPARSVPAGAVPATSAAGQHDVSGYRKRFPPILIKSHRREPRFSAVFVHALAGLASGQDLATLDLSARCNVSFIVAPVRICIMIAPAPLRGTEKGATPDDRARKPYGTAPPPGR
jgi:hypothetical protein